MRAAHELFVRNGYQATTLTAVADAAGVAHRTVYVRFGTKAALLKRVIDVALVGGLAPIDVVSREWYRTATTAPTLEERIAALAKGSARPMASAADVIAVAREAEPAEPLLAAAAHAGRAATRNAIRAICAGLVPGWINPEQAGRGCGHPPVRASSGDATAGMRSARAVAASTARTRL